MKNVLILIFILLEISLFGQKVDIDNVYTYISCVSLPPNYIPENERVFKVKTSGTSNLTGPDRDEAVNIYGWLKTVSNPTLDVQIKIYGFKNGGPQSSSRTEEVKDKNGKVTSRTTYYKYYATNTGSGDLFVYGKKNIIPKASKKDDNDKDKKKVEKKKKADEAEENPFLKNVDIKKTGETQANEGSAKLPLAYAAAVGSDYNYNTSEYTSAGSAFEEYKSNANSAANNHENKFRDDYIKSAVYSLNSWYGYMPYNYRVKFKRLDTEKHPEFKMFDAAVNALKQIFGKMRYNVSEEIVAKDLEPVIQYFESVTKKYKSKDDKHERRLREASLYNLARIYQYLDMHDKTIEIANLFLIKENDYDEGDGKDFIKESTEIKRQLEFHNMKSRHIGKRTDDEKDETGEQEAGSN